MLNLCRPRQRRQRGGIFVENGGAADAEIGLDPLHQHAAENIAPAIVVADADAGRLRGAGETLAIRCAVRQRRQQIDAGKAGKRLRDGELFRRGEGIGGAAAKRQLPRPRRLRRGFEDRCAIVHQHPIRLACAIPFDEREFRMMQRAALAVAEHLGKFDDARLAGGKKFLAGEFRRGAQIKRRRRAVRRQQASWRSRADGSRFRAKPAAPKSRPRQNPAPRTSRASAATIRLRANSAGRRSACTCGAQKGEEWGVSSGMPLFAEQSGNS